MSEARYKPGIMKGLIKTQNLNSHNSVKKKKNLLKGLYQKEKHEILV